MPIESVVLLYDSAIMDMQRALSAMQKSDIQRRAAEVGRAMAVLEQLESTLDFERGGIAAKQFEKFYGLVRAKLLEAQMRGSPELLQQQIRCMSAVREDWVAVKRQLQSTPDS